jgi:hypothetical protein
VVRGQEGSGIEQGEGGRGCRPARHRRWLGSGQALCIRIEVPGSRPEVSARRCSLGHEAGLSPARRRVWHVAGTTVFHMRADLHERCTHIDMQKNMMAVLTAMQEENERKAAEAASAASPAET